MSFCELRLEYALEGSSNYIAWKDSMEAVLKENELKELTDTNIPMPTTTDAQDLAEWNKCVSNARRIIPEGVRDHIVSNIHEKETPYAMWKPLMELFKNIIYHMRLSMKEMLMKIKMEKGDTIPKYLTMFTHYLHELGSVDVTVVEDDAVSLTLVGLPKIWYKYHDSINEREKIPEWQCLWSNLVQEEIQ